jgi:DNA-binding HxlR family transcriptional regulator
MTSTALLHDMIALGRYRWSIPLLADIHAHDGARFAELTHRMQISRDSLSRTLQSAVASGWIVRNSGYGHPLRPEYVIATEGKRIARTAAAIHAVQNELGVPNSALGRWSLPIIRSVADGAQRFNQLNRALSAAGPRALSQSLRTLAVRNLITRELQQSYPPSSLYSLTVPGQMMADAALQ